MLYSPVLFDCLPNNISNTAKLSFLKIEEELWEEEFIERCFQEMLEEEEEHEWFIPARDLPQTINHLQEQLNGLVIGDGNILEDLVVSICQTNH